MTNFKKNLSKGAPKRVKRLHTDGLDKEAIKLTLETVSKEQLFEDYAIIAYNIDRCLENMNEKQALRAFQKLLHTPFVDPKRYEVKKDIEQLLYMNLEELLATKILMTEILYGELDAKKKGGAKSDAIPKVD